MSPVTSKASLSASALDAARLKSEMQAFKAANPGSVLEDYVRWRMPDEWTPSLCMDDGSQSGDGQRSRPSESDADLTRQPAGFGRLSERLSEPGSLWQVLWRVTAPVAASEQRPLFNAEAQALEALESLETWPVLRLIPELIYLTIEAVLYELSNYPLIDLMPHVRSEIHDLGGEARKLLDMEAPADQWAPAIIVKLGAIETTFCRAASLAAKFPNQVCDTLGAQSSLPMP